MAKSDKELDKEIRESLRIHAFQRARERDARAQDGDTGRVDRILDGMNEKKGKK